MYTDSVYYYYRHVNGMNMERFQSYYYSRKQPIVFKGISLGWPAWKHWRRTEFIKR